MNLADIIVVSVLTVMVIAAIVFIVNNRRKGKGCSRGCENCNLKCDKRK